MIKRKDSGWLGDTLTIRRTNNIQNGDQMKKSPRKTDNSDSGKEN